MRRLAALGIAAVLLLTGCASAPTADPVDTPSPTAFETPTPSPTPTPEPVLEPTPPFGGDCSRVLDDAQLDDLLGDGWKTAEEMFEEWGTVTTEYIGLTPLRTIGGLACTWFVGEDVPLGEVQHLEVTVAPAAEVPADFTARYAEPLCESSYDGAFCRQVRIVGDAWVMARAGISMEDTFDAFLARALDHAETSLSGGIDAVPVDRNSSWWQVSECDSLGKAMRMHEVLGENYITGFWEGSEQPEQILLREGGVGIMCQWITGNDELSPDGQHHIITLLTSQGGEWEWEAIAAHDDVEEIAVVGAERAATYSPRELPFVFASDGVNVLLVDGGDSVEFVSDLAARALAALR